mgnify:CR=1 FL=1|tara:strand:- start:4082 stop:6220 length:2139 start_codon:yes stop_codon:yes gene_type:complete
MPDDIKKILKKYEKKLQGETDTNIFSNQEPITTTEYTTFRKEILEKKVTYYEKLCNTAEKILHINTKEKDKQKLWESINLCHLDITPDGATSFAGLTSLLTVLLGMLIGGISYALGNFLLFPMLLLVIVGLILVKPLNNIPHYIANKWRLEVSNQMVLCILYVVMYMRHTSNLEHAIKFAAEHVGGPLSLDLKKVFWDIETEKHFTIKESLDTYLQQWKGHNLEFVESFHLIEGSLYENNDQRRIAMLEKALQVMLDGTYEKMLHYAHNLQSPITILHMLGVILPILGLVIFPLIGSFLSGLIQWYHLFILYNLILPLLVMGMGYNLLNKRPTGYGGEDILQQNPAFKQYQEYKIGGATLSTAFITTCIIITFVLIGFLPFIIHYTTPGQDFAFLGGKFLDFKDGNGPYGLGALLLSLLIPLGIALGLSFYFGTKSKKLIEIKKKTDDLELEFSGALFQLGNRIGDGMPAEIAFGKVSESMQGTPSGEFFKQVTSNIRRLGMGLHKAIFDPQKGAILLYPSRLIDSSMKILVESSRKGSQIVSKSMLTISDYFNRIRKVNERLKDLLADVLSSMKSQTTFLTPLIAGIVVGVGIMVVTIINKLGEQFQNVTTGGTGEGFTTGLGTIATILNIKDVIPSFHFQIIVGLYVIEIIIVLTILSTTIERGYDKTTTRYRLSKNILRGTGLYLIVSLLGALLFTVLANSVSIVGTIG